MISVVPIIYDSNTKNVLRIYLLDSESQRQDPAFNPNPGESMINVLTPVYQSFRTVDDIQNFVSVNAVSVGL